MATDSLYFAAATIVEQVRKGRGTVRSLCYGSKFSNKKALFALVSEALKNYAVLEEVVRASEICKQERRISNVHVALVLLQDFLYKGKLGCQPKTAVLLERHKARLNGEFVRAKLKIAAKKTPVEASAPVPRYVRINRLKVGDRGECMEALRKAGFDTFTLDEHINDLLRFPEGTDFSKAALYTSGRIVLQDKASCMPAHILAPPPGSTVIDACAAPGNKTSHLAALMRNTGKIFAFERNSQRYETLVRLTSKAGCSNITAKHADFLKINPTDPEYAAVEYALVDPSCSGSGIIQEHESTVRPDEKERLRTLSNFQCMILRHAMKFPNLKRLVYSTCSIHEEENEMVVEQVLAAEPAFALQPDPLPSWTRRGLPTYPFHASVIRADPHVDGTHGFFVASFYRK